MSTEPFEARRTPATPGSPATRRPRTVARRHPTHRSFTSSASAHRPAASSRSNGSSPTSRPTPGMAFVVLQHLSPDFKSLMDELLARRTALPIRQAEHEMPVEPNTVYLLPPMKEMIIRERRLLLSDRDPRHGLTLPIDHLLPLARAGRRRARGRGGPVGQRQRRIARHAGDQPRRRHGVLREPRHGAVQRHAAQRHAHRRRRSGAAAGGDRARRSRRSARPSRAGIARPRTPTIDERGVDAILRLLRDEYAHRLLALQGRHRHAPDRAPAGAEPIARHRRCTSSSCAAIRASSTRSTRTC